MASSHTLSAGAGKVDITPDPEALPAPYTRISDHIYARAVVLDNGSQRVVLVTVDVPTIAEDVADLLRRRIAVIARTPVQNVLLSGTHTHNSLRLMREDRDGMRHVTVHIPVSDAFHDAATAGVVAAVEQALAQLRPARVGYGTGHAALTGNRNQWLPAQHRYIDGVDRTRTLPVDHRVGVLTIQDPAGRPIAFMVNYAIEAMLTMPTPDALSGDVPGATARYLEDRFDGEAVALFTIGAPGNCLYHAEPTPFHRGTEPQALVAAIATILGEEALATSARTPMDESPTTLFGIERTFECPGKITTPLNWPGHCDCSDDPTVTPPVFSDQDAPPVTASMGLLRIGDLALVHVDAVVSPAVWLKLAETSPLAKTLLASIAYGPMHYIVADADYALHTYEATASMAKPGHAEEAFLATSLEMLAHALDATREEPEGSPAA